MKSICRLLREHDLPIVPSNCYETHHHHHDPSRRALRDRELVELTTSLRDENRFLTRFDARKMWIQLRRFGHDAARCTIARRHRARGWQEATRRRQLKLLPSDRTPRPTDRVDLGFWAEPPNLLRVADFCHVPTEAGMAYVACMTTHLVLEPFEYALWSHQQQGIQRQDGLVHRIDAETQ